MTLRQLLRAADRTVRVADTLSADFARELAEVLRDTERRLVPIIAEALEGSNTAIIRAAIANRTRTQIREALTAAGYDVLAESAYGPTLDQLTDAILKGRKVAGLAADLTPRLEGRIDALKALAQLDLLDEGDAAARALWRSTVRGVFASRPRDQILVDLSRILDRTEPQIRTLYDTSISIYTRQVEALRAGDDPGKRFVFVGPVDNRMRDFCRHHVGKVYTREEIDRLDNKQIPPVFLTGGGYNCRHVWNEVSRFSELWDYAGTDRRIPEVSEQLSELEEAA